MILRLWDGALSLRVSVKRKAGEPAPWMELIVPVYQARFPGCSIPPYLCRYVRPVVSAVGPDEAAVRLRRLLFKTEGRFLSRALADFQYTHSDYATELPRDTGVRVEGVKRWKQGKRVDPRTAHHISDVLRRR